MKRIEASKKLFRSAGIAFCIVYSSCLHYLADKIKITGSSSSTFIILITLSIIVLAFLGVLLENAFDLFVERSPWIRQRIFGRMYVEGYWLECAFDHRNEMISMALKIIAFDSATQSVKISGQDYQPTTGAHLSSFTGTSVTLQEDKRRIIYIYEVSESGREAQGMGSLTFDEATPSFERFIGWFSYPGQQIGLPHMDRRSWSLLEVRGKLIKKEEDVCMIADPAYLKRLLSEFAKESKAARGVEPDQDLRRTVKI